MPLGNYGYDPAQYRSNFDFIGKAGQQVGEAVDAGVAQSKEKKLDAMNQQLYSEAVQHAQAMGDTGKKIGFVPEAIPKPMPGQRDYHVTMTQYAMKMYQAAAEQNVHQQMLDSSKALGAKVAGVESGAATAPTQQAAAEGVTAGREQGAAETQMAQPQTLGPQTDRPAMLKTNVSGQTAFDMNASPEAVAKQDTGARPVTSTELSDAAASQGLSGDESVKSMVGTREKREAAQEKGDLATQMGELRTSLADKNNQTKIDIDNANNAVKIALAREHDALSLKLDAFKRGDKKAESYEKLHADYLKLQQENEKAMTDVEDRIHSGLTTDRQADHVKALSDNKAAIDAEIKQLDDAEKASGTALGKAKATEKKPLTPDVVSQAKTKFGSDKKAAKKWLKSQGYDVQ